MAHILVVEDDDAVRSFVERALEMDGHTVTRLCYCGTYMSMLSLMCLNPLFFLSFDAKYIAKMTRQHVTSIRPNVLHCILVDGFSTFSHWAIYQMTNMWHADRKSVV